MERKPRYPEESRPATDAIDDRACGRMRELLSSMLDGEATVADRASALRHVERCAGCAGWLRAQRALHDALARRGRSGPLPRRTPRDVVRWVHQEDRRRTRAAGLRRLAVAASLVALAWLGASVGLHDSRRELPCDEILVHLEVLEDLQEQGIEPTPELLDLLLETEGPEPDAQVDLALIDLEIFEVLLEEEILPESL